MCAAAGFSFRIAAYPGNIYSLLDKYYFAYEMREMPSCLLLQGGRNRGGQFFANLFFVLCAGSI
jgi:hypothetical protein